MQVVMAVFFVILFLLSEIWNAVHLNKQIYSVYTINFYWIKDIRFICLVLYRIWQNHIYQEKEKNFVEIDLVSKPIYFQCEYYCRTKPTASIGVKIVECFKRKVVAVARKIFTSSTILRKISNTLHPPCLGVMVILRKMHGNSVFLKIFDASFFKTSDITPLAREEKNWTTCKQWDTL